MTVNFASAKVNHKRKRASAPKSRNGCITWIRHVKCDETKPTCHRCSNEKFKCNGYAMSKPPKQTQRKPHSEDVQTVLMISPLCSSICHVPSLTSTERLFFQHFLQWTSKQLSLSADPTNFWLRFALPMAYQSDPIRYSMVAVGASHRLFMARSLGHSNSDELKRFATHEYNKAIASIIPGMSTSSKLDIHTVLICCLLFVSFEGLTGRYDELLRHLSAGIALFHSPLPSSSIEERTVTEKLAEMFSRLGVESSNFMEADPSLSGMTQWYHNNSRRNSQPVPFNNLDEASYELRQLDMQYDKPWHYEGSDKDDKGSLTANACSILQDALHRWTVRFDAFSHLKEPELSTEGKLQYHNLRLRQQYWQMTIDGYASEEAESSTQAFESFLAAARKAAAPLIALGQPTFSLDGDLISGLAVVASSTKNDGIRVEALDLLWKLNRREGLLDSHDIVEMHKLARVLEGSKTMTDHYEVWEGKAAAGIPKIIERLRRNLGK